MKVAVYIFVISITMCYALEDGKYVPDNSGAYIAGDEGHYIPDDSGKYIPDYSGLYQPDGTGKYFDDGSGKYRDSIEKYDKNQHTTFQTNLLSAGTIIRNKFVKPNLHLANSLVSRSATQYGKYDDSRWKIIRQVNGIDTDGYHWEYETENEINAEESGKIHNINTDDETLKTNGFFKYTGPDNVIYSIKYTADENGFIPDGDHLPLGIQRALAHIASKKV